MDIFKKLIVHFSRYFILPFAVGMLAVSATPPYFQAWILFLTFPLIFWLLYKTQTKSQAFAVGFSYGLGYFVMLLIWAIIPFLRDNSDMAWMMSLTPIVFPVFLALLLGLTFLVSWLLPVKGLAKIIMFSTGFGVYIWFTGRVIPHIPMSLFGYVWSFSDAIMQITAYIGVYGLSYLTILLCTSPVAIIMPVSTKSKTIYLLLTSLLALSIYGLGILRLSQAKITSTNVGVRLVHTHFNQQEKQADNEAVFKRVLNMSTQPAPFKLNFIVWPEDTTNRLFALNDNMEKGETINAISQIAPQDGAVIFGSDTAIIKEADKQAEFLKYSNLSHFYNSLIAVAPNNQITAIYHKKHLMPFSEYNPIDWLFKMPKLLDVLKAYDLSTSLDYTPGTNRPTVAIGNLPGFVPLICYEAIFSGEVIENQPRPDWILVISNDFWFKDTTAIAQHFAALKARAVEEGLPLLRAANYGFSAVIDPYGRILQQLKPGTEGTIDTLLPKPLPITLYGRYGNYILLLLLMISLIVVVWLNNHKN